MLRSPVRVLFVVAVVALVVGILAMHVPRSAIVASHASSHCEECTTAAPAHDQGHLAAACLLAVAVLVGGIVGLRRPARAGRVQPVPVSGRRGRVRAVSGGPRATDPGLPRVTVLRC